METIPLRRGGGSSKKAKEVQNMGRNVLKQSNSALAIHPKIGPVWTAFWSKLRRG